MGMAQGQRTVSDFLGILPRTMGAAKHSKDLTSSQKNPTPEEGRELGMGENVLIPLAGSYRCHRKPRN